LKSQFVHAMDLLQEETKKGDLTLRKIADILGEEGHSIFLLFLSLPYMIPVSIPGMSTPAGLLIALVAIMLYLRRPVWIPKRWEKLHVSATAVAKVSEGAERVWLKVSHLVKERWIFFHDSPFFRSLNLFIFVANGILLALPLPIPLTNTMPGIAIILCSLGHTEKDGFFILCSYLWTVLVFLFFGSLALSAKLFV